MGPTKRAEKMEENRRKLIASARRAFAEKGFASASMDEMTADAGLTRGALYHNFGDKRGLFAAVVAQVDSEMAARAQDIGAGKSSKWDNMLGVGDAYIRLALDPEVRQIVLLDGPAVLGDPAHWPSQNACLEVTRRDVAELIADGIMKPVDVEAASRLLNGLALNAALWVAASEDPETLLPEVIEVFHRMCEGLLAVPSGS
ncbi:TetR/AcrR family transcriptional regulator [Pseudohoeflea suaedae]|uniref:TetR/AcrR family transcriptional regulator n=1 Tax=Pseudohoeflea suaedae TaxID=877384 RepID=A0A4V3A700_9HYPH|nr:TetR/AcrR family transcriptional regulator [Pseudohoeflea suaedae]TDH35118.1 TetR/AcrR family transcriptional regulator [Pseudohoeflea suaedae]